MKKKILFFHRAELTHLYFLLSQYLSSDFEIVNVAYSEKEEKILIDYGVHNVIVMTREIDKLIATSIVDYKILRQLDEIIIQYSDGRFNLNSSIKSDRGFAVLTYEESLLLSQIYYQFWEKLFSSFHIDYVFHEPPAVQFVFLLTILCKKYSSLFIWHIMTKGEDGDNYYYLNVNSDFKCVEIIDKIGYYRKFPNSMNVERCMAFINDFRDDYGIYLGKMINNRISNWRLFLQCLKHKIKKIYKVNPYDRLSDNISYWLFEQDNLCNKWENIKDYHKLHISFEEMPSEPEQYYYYPLHLEPEAVVLYLGDGIYANQIKLVENIAASLPVGSYLYVKDHPHEYAYRKADDYLRLMKIPNIRLLKSSIPGKKVISKAVGVFTINGSAGFEALLMGKQVFCFGRNYYLCCDRVKYIHNIRDLRSIVYSNLSNKYNDDEELYSFVNAYLDSLHKGIVDYFNHRAEKYGINLLENAKTIANDFKKYSEMY